MLDEGEASAEVEAHEIGVRLGHGEGEFAEAPLGGSFFGGVDESAAHPAPLGRGVHGEEGEVSDAGGEEGWREGGFFLLLEEEHAHEARVEFGDEALAAGDAPAGDLLALAAGERAQAHLDLFRIGAVEQIRELSRGIAHAHGANNEFGDGHCVHRRVRLAWMRAGEGRAAALARSQSVDSRLMLGSGDGQDLSEEALAPSAPIPLEGELRLRVRYCECDPMGVAHHSACVPWLEMGRTELLRCSGVTYAQLEAASIFLVVTRLELSYKSPARYDDVLVLVTSVLGGSRARIDHGYQLWRDREDGRGRSELLLTAESTLACVSAQGSPRALPEWLVPSRRVARAARRGGA